MPSTSLNNNLHDSKPGLLSHRDINQAEDAQDEAWHAPAASHQYHPLGCRSFWKAASQDAFLKTPHSLPEILETSDFQRSRVHPKFLHTNATSHKWAFGAIAELLDNAVDEIFNGATFIKVDKVCNRKDDNSPVLIFQDDGGGMDPDGIRRCMSLGFSAKKATKSIGQYGNGFKTSTMRLGADAIVFSCSTRGGRQTRSIGLLSYTFLVRTMKNDIIVPMVDFEILDGRLTPIVYGSQDEWDNSLKIILDWSIFCSMEELIMQFEDIGNHGTKILVYNLWYDDEGRLELDFDDDKEDIRLRNREESGYKSNAKTELIQSHISYTFRYSLRAYTSILYLKSVPNFCIILRGKLVQQIQISNELKFTKTINYRPFIGKDESVDAIIGFSKEAPLLGTYGFNIYHKNRLIMPFWKVFHDCSVRGKCVIGVLEANFIEPAHDKQEFERSPLFNRLEVRLKKMISDYWNNHCHLLGYQSPFAEIRDKQKQSSTGSTVIAPGMVRERVADQHVEKPIKNQLNTSAVQRLNGQAADHHGEVHIVSSVSELDMVGNSTNDASDVSSSVQRQAQSGSSYSTSVQKLTEQNIHLFMKREEYRSREAELKQTIQKLEDALEETKRKCAKISSEIEKRRKLQH